FILAHASLDNRCVCKYWKTLGHIKANSVNPSLGNYSLTRIRVECVAMCVDGDLESSFIQIWNSVDQVVEVDPCREGVRPKEGVSRWWSNEKDFLLRNMDYFR